MTRTVACEGGATPLEPPAAWRVEDTVWLGRCPMTRTVTCEGGRRLTSHEVRLEFSQKTPYLSNPPREAPSDPPQRGVGRTLSGSGGVR